MEPIGYARHPAVADRVPAIWFAATVGLGAGLIASFVMNRVQAALPAPDTDDASPATEVAAARLHKAATDRRLPTPERHRAGSAVHYALGGALGAAYGVAAEIWPPVARGGGVPFGLSAALLLDEIVVPAAGFSKPPWRYGAGTHVYGLVSHAVFGASLEAARRGLQRLLSTNKIIPNSGRPQASRSVAG